MAVAVVVRTCAARREVARVKRIQLLIVCRQAGRQLRKVITHDVSTKLLRCGHGRWCTRAYGLELYV